MTKDVAYYRTLPYEREWLARDDESGRYFVVRLKDIPEIYGTGWAKQEALAALRSAFDDQITWCLEEGLPISEPSTARATEPQTIEVQVERVTSVPTPVVQQASAETRTRAGVGTESYRGSMVDVREFQEIAA